MSIVTPEAPTVPSPTSAGTLTSPPPASPTAAVSHPTPCPLWCKDRHDVASHHFGPTATWHWSQEMKLSNPFPADGDPVTVLRAELLRDDEDAETGEVRMYLQAQGDIDLGRDDADVLIADMQAFVDKLRILRRQMG